MIISIATNLVLVVIGHSEYSIFGPPSTIIFVVISTYAIIKHHLFNIRVILTEIFIGIVGFILLIQAFSAPTFVWRIVNFLLLSFFLLFGILLIQSVLREIKLREQLEVAYKEVDRLSRAKSEFLSIASHQLRTPLTAIKGYVSMLIEGTYGKLEEKPKAPLEKVYQSNERLINLVNDLLNISRIESGTLKVDIQKTSFAEMVASIIDELKIKSQEKDLYLKLEKPKESLPKISVDADKIRQVVMNIIDNCIKYTEKGGITARFELKMPTQKWPEGSILLKIQDTGEGMGKEEIGELFESFKRGRAGAKHWVAGMGLGLYIARKFTELHNGRIWVESEGEGKGSIFFIELPVK